MALQPWPFEPSNIAAVRYLKMTRTGRGYGPSRLRWTGFKRWRTTLGTKPACRVPAAAPPAARRRGCPRSLRPRPLRPRAAHLLPPATAAFR